MYKFVRPALLHRYWRCEVCRKLTDCTFNVRVDRWLCSTDALQHPLEATDYAWVGLEKRREGPHASPVH